jgi:aspartate aminotransferase
MAESINESPTLALDAKFKSLVAEGIDIIGFGAGEPDFDTPDHIKQAAIEAIKSGYTKYTPVAGDLALRKAVCGAIGMGHTPDQIVVSNGAKQSILNALIATVNVGDEVIIPSPYWVSYPEMVKLASGEPVLVETTEEDGYKLTLETLKRTVTPKTKVIVLNYPSNPLGVTYSKDELQVIADFAVENNLYVISDEIYDKVLFDGVEHVSIASLGEKIKDLTVVVAGVSKSYAMTGWRIGYTASNAKMAKVMANVQSHATSNACSISQKAALAALTGPQEFIAEMGKAFEERRNFLMKKLDELGIPYIRPQGAFYIMLDVSGLQKNGEDTDAFCGRLLDDAKLLLVPGTGFGAEGFVRWSFAASIEKIEEGLRRLARFIGKL